MIQNNNSEYLARISLANYRVQRNVRSVLKLDFYIFLLIFQHRWMFLSTCTMQTLPNQIPLGPAERISLLSFLVEWGFYFCRICTCQDFGLLGVWFTEFTLYQPFSWALKEKVDLLWNPDCLCLHQWIVQKCSCWKSTWQGLCK